MLNKTDNVALMISTHSVATSMRMGKSGVTYGSAPTFRSAQRAEKRKEVK